MNANEPPKDHVDGPDADGAGSDDDALSKVSWQRLLFMVIMWVLFCLGVTVGMVVVVLQFFWVLINGEPKKELSAIGRQLGEYAREIAEFMTFATDERPFPFDRDWPSD
jgi:flagellar basal body-associated protein FliL